MTLKANAIITLEELKSFLEISNADIQISYLTIYNSASGATAATVQVTATSLVLVVTGGGSAGTSTLAFAGYPTLTLMVAAINVLNKGWTANIQGVSGEGSSGFTILPATGCLLAANVVTLYGANNYRLETYINAVSDFFERETGMTVNSLAITNEELDGNGKPMMWLNHFPVISLSSLTYYDRYQAATLQTLTQDTDFWMVLASGKLVASVGSWIWGVRNIRASYTAGFSTVPDDIKMLCMQLIELRMNKRGKTGMSAVTIGRYSETFTKESVPVELQAELDKFKRIIF